MAKQKENYYFQNFIQCINISLRAADKLSEILKDFGAQTLKDEMDSIHVIEHEGDVKKHEMISELYRAFITPIEREDIVALSHAIDNVTDAIEDILICMYTWNITHMRPDVNDFMQVIVECVQCAKKLLEELPQYKKSKVIGQYIVDLNNLEEKGDVCYIQCLRKLSVQNNDTQTVMAWREIYKIFENVCDCCENVADIVEAIIIANT